MHFITGGACNGKAKWVKEQYNIAETLQGWRSAYKHDPCPHSLEDVEGSLFIAEGLEQWVKEDAGRFSAEEISRKWQVILAGWQLWEQQKPERTCILIGSDLTKGIVPADKTDRTWRDAAGWVFQHAASRADRVDIIWYGINQRIK